MFEDDLVINFSVLMCIFDISAYLAIMLLPYSVVCSAKEGMQS